MINYYMTELGDDVLYRNPEDIEDDLIGYIEDNDLDDYAVDDNDIKEDEWKLVYNEKFQSYSLWIRGKRVKDYYVLEADSFDEVAALNQDFYRSR